MVPTEAPRLRELIVDAPAAREALVVAAVYRLGVQGLQVRDAESGAPAGRVHVVAWLPPSPAASRAIRALRRRLGADTRCAWRDIPVTWEAAPPAVPIGARFVVVAPGVVAPTDRDALVLDAHLAFGDGLHPTTVLCVEALERRAPSSATVLDVGTGTGILAIVAARLGATRVVAQDIDPLSLWAARRHVDDNGVAAIVTVVDTLPDTFLDGPFDLVVANLYFAPLLALLPAMALRVAPGGALILSGFGVEARARVEAACVTAGLIVRESWERDGWGMLVCETRKAGREESRSGREESRSGTEASRKAGMEEGRKIANRKAANLLPVLSLILYLSLRSPPSDSCFPAFLPSVRHDKLSQGERHVARSL